MGNSNRENLGFCIAINIIIAILAIAAIQLNASELTECQKRELVPLPYVAKDCFYKLHCAKEQPVEREHLGFWFNSNCPSCITMATEKKNCFPAPDGCNTICCDDFNYSCTTTLMGCIPDEVVKSWGWLDESA